MIHTTMKKTLELLNRLPDIPADVNVYQKSAYIYYSVTDLTASQLRKVKEVFGPFESDGSPPYVTLRRDFVFEEEEYDYYHFYIELQGAFKCEITHTTVKHKELSTHERESLRKSIREMEEKLELGHTVTSESEYSCSPAQPKPDPVEEEPTGEESPDASL